MIGSRIHITGASGCGVSALGAALAGRLGIAYLDTDSFYWLPTPDPFTEKRPVETRFALLEDAFAASPQGWVLSGSLDGWGDPLVPRFDLVVFLRAPTEIRMARLRARERHRYGAVVEPGGERHEASQEFLAWCAGYDAGVRTGRSLARRLAWLERLSCPVIRLDGTAPTEALADAVIACFAKDGRS
jgi:adenylate kinase family enzyme